MSGNGKQSTGGAQAGSSGSDDESNNNLGTGEGESASSVKTPSPEWHQRVLSEKKREQEKRVAAEKERDDLLAKIKQQDEAELTKKGETDKLLKIREGELEAERNKVRGFEQERTLNLKLSAVLNQIGGDVPDKTWKLIELDQVVMDPSTGLPDPASVKNAAEAFKKDFSALIRKPTGVQLPNGAPSPGGTLTYEEWLKLPAKEMKKRMSEVTPKS